MMLHTPTLDLSSRPFSPSPHSPLLSTSVYICIISEWKNISDLLFPKYVNQSNNSNSNSNSLTLLFILNEQKSFTTVIDNTLYKFHLFLSIHNIIIIILLIKFIHIYKQLKIEINDNLQLMTSKSTKWTRWI